MKFISNLILILIVVSISQIHHCQAQKIYRPDLEEFDTTQISRYYSWTCDRPFYKLLIDSATCFSGKKSILIYPIYYVADSDRTVVFLPADNIDYKDTVYLDSFAEPAGRRWGGFGTDIPNNYVEHMRFVKIEIFVHSETDNYDKISVYCMFGNKNRGLIKSEKLFAESKLIRNNIEWIKYSGVLKIPKDAKIVYFACISKETAKVWIDNLTFTTAKQRKSLTSRRKVTGIKD